jgi:hypothetical protein
MIFFAKKSAKNLAFLFQNKDKIGSYHCFCEKHQFLRQKLAKIAGKRQNFRRKLAKNAEN